MKLYKAITGNFPLGIILILIFSSKAFSQANDGNCCIKNVTQSSLTTIEFDVWIEWTGSNSQKLNFFQAGINFNYIGIANGGTITGAFKPGSASTSLPAIQQSPNWNINQSSKQIRLLAAIASSGTATSIPAPPGFRLGTFVMTNTVPFATFSNPNFVWSFLTGAGTTTKTVVSLYLNGATTGTGVTDAINFCIVSNPCPGAPCPFPNAGGPYTSCGDVHLNGQIDFLQGLFHWATSGSGTFDPNNQTVNAVYHPSAADLIAGSVTLSLITDATAGGCCAQFTSTATANFTSIDDNDPCTVDGCDQSTGLPTHSAPDCNVTLNSSVYIQGFYSGGGIMDNNGAGGFLYVAGVPGAVPTDADSIVISAMQPNPPYGLVDQQTVILHTDGSVSVTFGPSVVAGNSYYIKIRHRNSVETRSANPVLFSNVTNYSFSVSSSQAYSNNLIQTPDNLYYAIFNGDINQDCAIDGTDFLELNIGIQNGLGGYLSFDLNGDGTVDGADFLLLDYNIQNGFGCP